METDAGVVGLDECVVGSVGGVVVSDIAVVV